jgi:Lrp/AsnC family transcriptional regulator, leucine-responsive regulatory protein
MLENIDNTDLKILSILQENAKISHKEIAEILHLSRTPIFERIKKLERAGIIQKYVTLLNRKKINKKLIVLCSISIKEHGMEQVLSFQKAIDNFSEVMECYHIGGNYDFFLKVIVNDVDDYQTFVLKKLSLIKNIANVQSAFVIGELKYNLSYELGGVKPIVGLVMPNPT